MRRVAVVLLALSVLSAGCGTRVDDTVRQRAGAGILEPGGPGGGTTGLGGEVGTGGGADVAGGSTGSSLTTGGSGGSGGSSGASGTSTTGVSGATGTSGGGAGGGSTGAAAPAPASGNGGSTDVGVTADSITIGNVSGLSGPVPGLFEGAVNGTNAYVAYINSRGGVFGRKLKVAVGDDQTECGTNQNRYRDLSNKVFAFVGSFSLYDDCMAKVVGPTPKVPLVQYALSTQANDLPNLFSPSPTLPGYATGMFQYWNSVYGAKTKKIGSIYSRTGSAEASYRAIQKASESVGWEYVYERGAAAAEQDFTADIVRMRQEGVEIVFLLATNAANVARIKKAADSQSFRPIFIAPVAFDPAFIQLVGGPQAAEGIVGHNLFALNFTKDDAAVIPEVALYQEWMRRNDPKANQDLFSVFGWAAGALFVQALIAAGPQATRASLLAELRKVRSFSANGLVGQADPAGKKPTICYVLWEIKGGLYRRVAPAKGYRCDGTFFRA